MRAEKGGERCPERAERLFWTLLLGAPQWVAGHHQVLRQRPDGPQAGSLGGG